MNSESANVHARRTEKDDHRPRLFAIASEMSEPDERNNDVPAAGMEALRCVSDLRDGNPTSYPSIRTLVGGMAHAQSLTSDPRVGAIRTFSSASSVVPIHIMYEPTRWVTCKARGGRDGSAG